MADVDSMLPHWSGARLELYHGTLDLHARSILRGVELRHARPRSDFGRGFYATTSVIQAWRWAQQLSDHTPGAVPAVVLFEVSRVALAELHCLWFIRGDTDADDFWSVVQECRIRGWSDDNTQGSEGWYDVVAGPVAANWRRRRMVTDSDQVDFRSTRAVALLNTSPSRRI